MKQSFVYFLAIFCVLFVACGNGEETPNTEKESHSMHGHGREKDSKLPHTLATEKKDPVCGMPVTAGITDTAHCKGKVFGFCAIECKQLFLGDPESYFAAE